MSAPGRSCLKTLCQQTGTCARNEPSAICILIDREKGRDQSGHIELSVSRNFGGKAFGIQRECPFSFAQAFEAHAPIGKGARPFAV